MTIKLALDKAKVAIALAARQYATKEITETQAWTHVADFAVMSGFEDSINPLSEFFESEVARRATWAVYEALRRLGFRDDDITYKVSRVMLPSGIASQNEYLTVNLNAQDKEFVVVVHPIPTDKTFEETRDFLEKLRLAISDRSLSDEDLRALWDESRMANLAYFGSFTAAIINYGFILPALAN